MANRNFSLWRDGRVGRAFLFFKFSDRLLTDSLHHEPFEFGYAVGISHPLALAARPETCYLYPENFQAGVEMYGGLEDPLRVGRTLVARGRQWQITAL